MATFTPSQIESILLDLCRGTSGSLPAVWHFVLAQCGLLHLFCISGMHIMAIFMIGLRAIQMLLSKVCWVRLRASRSIPLVATLLPILVLLVAYLVFLRFSFPSLRAFFSLVSAISLLYLGLRPNPFILLVLISGISLIFSSSSWLSTMLSVSAVSGFIVFARELRGSKTAIGKLALLSLAPWLATIPVLAYSLHSISLVAPLINLLLLIPIAISFFPLLGLWFLTQSWTYGPLKDSLGKWCLQVLEFWVQRLERIAFTDGVTLWIPPKTWLIGCAFLFITGMILSSFKNARYRFILSGITLLILCLAKTFLPVNTEAYQLDVAQGDSLLVRENTGHATLVDAGRMNRNAYPVRASMELAKLGQAELNQLLLTHTDADHYGGFASVLLRHRFSPSSANHALWIPYASLYLRKVEHILAVAEQQRVPIQILPEGEAHYLHQNIWCYSDSWSYLAVANNHSPICKVQLDRFDYLIGGDMLSNKESRLGNSIGEGLRASIFKLNHHGSKSSNSVDFLNRVQPKIAVVSSGSKNRYHHPHLQILNRLERARIPWISTSVSGTVPIHSLVP